MEGKIRIILLSGAMAMLWGWTVAPALKVWAQPDPATIVRGETVYAEKKCAMCHAIKGKGGKSGGDLTTVGAKRDAAWLKQFTKEPKSVMPNAKMPPFKGTEQELEAVVAYMTSLQ